MASGGGAQAAAQRNYEEKQATEVAMAQMETRLRGVITEIINPTIQRTALVVSDVDSLKSLVSQQAKGLQEVQLGQFKAMEQVSTITSFKEEMSRWDTQRRTHEASLDEKVETMQQKLDAYQYSLEQKESAIHHLHRNVDRTATEVNHLSEDVEAGREVFEQRLDELSRKINQEKAETAVRLASFELRHNAITDELWGEETGLAKVAGELKKTNASFGKLEEAVAKLEEEKAEAAQLDKLRAEVQRMVHDANTAVGNMQQTVGNVVNDVREHFRTAAQTISAHNATFIGEVRGQYQEELAAAAQLRGEVESFVAQTAQSIASLDDRVEQAAAKASSLAAEAREEVEELNKRRKRDKSSMDNELKALKKRLGGVFDNSDTVLRGIEHMYSVMQLILKSDLMSCSVDLQDTIDRKRIALMGVKDDETLLSRTTQSEPQRPRPECRSKSSGKLQNGTLRGTAGCVDCGNQREEARKPVVRVDNRCLSCSGQAPLVLTAFKMACLQYSPSPVEHQGTTHDRDVLIQQRYDLLQNAQQALEQHPTTKGVGTTTDPQDMDTFVAFNSAKGAGATVGTSSLVAGDAFAQYAALEARYQHNQRGSNVQRLPNISHSSSPRSLSAR